MFSSHTGEPIFLHAVQMLDVLCPSWKNLIVSSSTDGESKMTGKIRGAATRFEQVSKPGFFRIWCGLHQLDLCLQSFFKATMDEQFYSWLNCLISYLRRQQTLITKMKTKAPKVADTRWESMSKVLYSAVGTLNEESEGNLSPCLAVLSEDRKYSIQLSDATAVLEDLGTFVIDSMQFIGQEDTEHIVKNFSTCSADLLSDIAAVVAERDSSNNAAESMPLFCRTS
ncbi:hypothetical protein PsorP6_016695 [Peronosclerospora sorghi]|uniref:Uncharacterized protein n=1 Tax=Peronosclerospora sorghi TaxID=230839 RepID=A0ACC0VL76_9STRA|nr:hypothetical protein PsorP6_016695 [Peronosclerospora sorghi]